MVSAKFRAFIWIAIAGLCAASGAHAASVTAAGSTRDGAIPTRSSPAPGADVRVWVPIDTHVQGRPPEGSGERSSATYRVEGSCPDGTWRWSEPRRSTEIELEIASALIVRLEPLDGMTPGEDRGNGLARAGEEIAAIFRMEAGPPADEPGASGPPNAAAGDSVETALGRWEAARASRIDAATATLAGTLVELAPSGFRMIAIVARERVTARCAPVERCENSRWVPGGHRAVTTRRLPLAPAFHGPGIARVSDPDAAFAVARELAEGLADWLQARYARDGAAAAILAQGGDPCEFSSNPDASRVSD